MQPRLYLSREQIPGQRTDSRRRGNGPVCAVRPEGKSATMFVTVFIALLLVSLSLGKPQQIQARSS